MTRRGLTLLELLVVLAILVALAALAVPLFGNRISSSELDSTYQTMLAIREAIMGNPGYFRDVKGVAFTRTIPNANSPLADAAGMPSSINDLFVNPGISINGNAFDPLSQKGWRGPYLNQTMGSMSTDPSTGQTIIRDSFPSGGNPGSPILLEWPTSATAGGIPQSNWYMYVRLRSYGLNGQPSAVVASKWVPSTLTAADYGDDLILYIRRDLPGIDWTNYWNLKPQGN